MSSTIETRPPPKVEVAFSTAPLSTPTWTDITEYVRGVSIRRGRDFELARYPTGTASILLDNRDRRFDPSYESGPYYPNVIPGRRIRVRAGSNIIGNSSFETDLTGYSTFVASAVRDAAVALYGSASAKVTTTNATASGVGRFGMAVDAVPLPVTAGTTYTFSCYGKLELAGSMSMSLQIQWFTAGGASAGASASAIVTLNSTTSWQRFSLTATAPATTAYVRLWFFTANAQGVFNYYTDGWQFEASSTARIYHDAVSSLFDGYIESWPQDWDNPSDSRTPLEAADGFKMLELRKLPGGYPQRVLADNPIAYWRFNETSGTTAADSSGNGNAAAYVNSPTLGVAGGLKGDSDTAVTTNWASGTRYISTVATATTAGHTAFSVEFRMKTTYSSASYGALLARGTNAVAGHYGFYLTPTTSALQFQIQTTTANYTLVTPFNVNTDNWVFVCGTWDGSTMRLYVDQWYSASAATTGTLASNTQGLHWGVQAGAVLFVGACSFDETSYYTYALSAAQVAAHQAAGSGAFPAQDSPDRVTAVLDAIGWPAGSRVTNGGTEPVQTSTLSNVTTLQHLQDVADAEAGRVFIDASGNVRFDGRDVFFTPPFTTNQAVFSDIRPRPADELGYFDLTAAYDDTQVWNDVRLTRAGGVEQVAQDADSIEAYGQRTLQSSSMLNTTDNNTLSLAQYRLSQYKDPLLRFTTLALRPGTDALTWEQVLERDIGDRVSVSRLPQGIPPAISYACWIEGIEHDITPGGWETRWRLSRADAQTYWILQDAASQLGVNTYLSF